MFGEREPPVAVHADRVRTQSGFMVRPWASPASQATVRARWLPVWWTKHRHIEIVGHAQRDQVLDDDDTSEGLVMVGEWLLEK